MNRPTRRRCTLSHGADALPVHQVTVAFRTPHSAFTAIQLLLNHLISSVSKTIIAIP